MAFRPASGTSLPELLVALAVAGLLAVVAVPPALRTLERHSLARSAALARAHLGRARMVAVGRRETVRVRVLPDRSLALLDGRDSVLARVRLAGGGLLDPDSVRLRPATLRFNARGQAAPGSLYLYRGRRGVRLVINFVGRVRQERLTL